MQLKPHVTVKVRVFTRGKKVRFIVTMWWCPRCKRAVKKTRGHKCRTKTDWKKRRAAAGW